MQTIMRRYKMDQPYEKLKSFTRGKRIDKLMLKQFIEALDLPADEKRKLIELTPDQYIGYAEELAKRI